MEEGENKYHDIPAKKENFDITELFKLDHEGRLYIHNHSRHPLYSPKYNVRIKHIVVRKEVYDEIVETMSYETWSTTMESNITLKKLQPYYQIYMSDMDAMEDEDHIFFLMNNKIGNTYISEILSEKVENGMSQTYPIDVVDKLRTMQKERDVNTEKLIDNAVRFFMFKMFMRMGRKSWHVPSGVGSQDDNVTAQELCAKVTLSAAKTVKQYFENINDE